MQVCHAPGGSHKVDGFGGAARENDVFSRGGIDKLRNAFARAFVGGGGAVAQFVDAAVHVGVVVLIIALNGLEHGARFLRGGGVVEVYQRMPVNLLSQRREIISDAG